MAPRQQEAAPRGDAIDQAVRDMMHVDTDPAFRARVLARLERPAPWVFPWTRAAVVGGAAAAVVLTVVLLRTGSFGTHPPAVATRSETPAPVAPPPLPTVDANRVAAVAPTPIARSTPRVPAALRASEDVPPGVVVAAVAGDTPAVVVDPLAGIDPISVAPIEPDPIGLSAIVIEPLAPITELEIAPLSPQIERD